MIDAVLLVAWRAWHNRNEVTHEKPLPSVESSKRFLCGYLKILRNSDVPREAIIKGKQLIVDTVSAVQHERPMKPPGKIWSKPPDGWVKLTVDGSFEMDEGTAGCGMVLRGADGNIIVSACRFLPRCVEVVEAELWACKEGLDLALEHSPLPVIVESDCFQVIRVASEKSLDRSPFLNIISDIRFLSNQDRVCKFVKVDRSEVRISHCLAEKRTVVWPGSGPDVVIQELQLELSVIPTS
jgi:ribonuclease HI